MLYSKDIVIHSKYAVKTDSDKKTSEWITVCLKKMCRLGKKKRKGRNSHKSKNNLKVIRQSPYKRNRAIKTVMPYKDENTQSEFYILSYCF